MLERAFGAGSGEADLVDALRAAQAHVPELCLVAIGSEGELVGHLFFKARLASGHDVLALASMAVLPQWQRRGVGSRMIEHGLERAERTAFPLVVVLGTWCYRASASSRPTRSASTAPWECPPKVDSAATACPTVRRRCRAGPYRPRSAPSRG